LFEKSPFIFNKIGKWWHKDKEIDIVALNEQRKEILFGECKCKDGVNPKEVPEDLKGKSKYLDWFNSKRKEYYVIFAKSFSKKINEENILLVDLKYMERVSRIDKKIIVNQDE